MTDRDDRVSVGARTLGAVNTTDAPRLAARPFSAIVIAVLVLTSGLAPLATSSYLPALPMAQASLEATPLEMQLTLTAFIVGTALGQLVFGPLSDRIGRRPAMLLGVAVYAIGGLAIVFSPDPTWMIAWRVVQGVGAGAGMALGRAVVADRAHGTVAAKLLGIMMAITILIPAAAPLVGVAVLAVWPWQAVFGMLSVLGAVILIGTAVWLPETRGERTLPHAPASGAPGAAPRIRSWRTYVAATVAIGLSFASMYAVISAGPYLYQGHLGFTPEQYAFATAAISLFAGAATFFGTRALGRVTRWGPLTPARLAAVSLGVLAVAGVALAILAVTDAPTWLWIVAMGLAMLPVGILSGCLTAIAMDAAPLAPGAASALIGLIFSAFGAAMPPIIGLGGTDPAGVMGFALLVCAVLAIAAFAVAVVRRNVARVA